MIALDTNVLVRYLVQDDESQFQAVLQLLNRSGAVYFVSDLVLVEVDRVLRGGYDWTHEQVADALVTLASVSNLQFENLQRIESALFGLRNGSGLADELIVRQCRDRGMKSFATFDKQILKRHKGFAILP